MNIYRSIELGTPILSELLSQVSDLSELKFHYEPISEDHLLNGEYDLIELSESQTQNIMKKFSMLDWEIQTSQAADCFIKQHDHFKPCQMNAEVFRQCIEFQKIIVDISYCAVLIGDYSFVTTFAMMLGKLGYKKIYIVSIENLFFGDRIDNLKKVLFDIELKQLSFDELATIPDVASLLAIDFELDENAEVVEILTYFNFLSKNAIFFDMQGYINHSLTLEAEKVQLKVINSLEFYITKYKLIQKKLNNRSKV